MFLQDLQVRYTEKLRSCMKAEVDVLGKLQALVYDILPSTTAVFSYAIGS